MKRPLASITLVYIAGLVAGELLPLPSDVLLPVALALAALLLFSLANRGSIRSETLVWPLLFATGWANLCVHKLPSSPMDLRLQGLHGPELVTIRGELAETPSQRVFVRDELESYRFLAVVRVSEIHRDTRNWERVKGQLLVLTPGYLPEDVYGSQSVEVTGVLSKPPGPAAPGLFDYAAYLERASIYYQLKTDGTNDWKLTSKGRPRPFSDRFLAWAHSSLGRGLATEDVALKMLWAMTLGWKTVNNDIYEPFMKSGTMHVFAVSGLHIALIAGIFVALLRVAQLPRSWCGVIVVPLIWFYTAATGWQPSAIRSTLMMSIIIGGWALSRPTDLLNSLAASAFCVLLWEPQQLFGASFQLSFFVVLSIAILLPEFERLREPLLVRIRLAPDPLLPPHLLPAWKRRLLVPVRWLFGSLAISLAAWLGSAPLTAYYFHLFSPVTLIANVLIVPLSSCALAANLGALLCAPWFGSAAEWLNHTAWLCMRLMISLSQGSASLPLACYWVQAPSVLTMVLYYAMLAVFLTRGIRINRRIFLPGAAFVALLGLWHWHQNGSQSTLTVLPLSGGFAVHASHSSGPDLLVDCGRSNAVQFTVAPFLHSLGTDRLQAFLLTHGDIRHVGGVNLLRADFSPRATYASRLRFRSSVYKNILKDIEAQDTAFQMVEPGHRIGPWEVLHPRGSDKFGLADDGSLVLRGDVHGARLLALGDLGEAGQTALLDRYTNLQSDLVITGLPVRGEPVTSQFLERVKPRAIVVVDSEFPAAERAGLGLQRRLRKLGIPVIYTRETGPISLRIGPRQPKAKTPITVFDCRGRPLGKW